MNGLNVQIAEKQHGDEMKSKKNLDTDMVERHHNHGVALVEQGKEMRKTVDIQTALGMANLIVVQDMIALVVTIKQGFVMGYYYKILY